MRCCFAMLQNAKDRHRRVNQKYRKNCLKLQALGLSCYWHFCGNNGRQVDDTLRIAHSLSYHMTTLTRSSPMTIVRAASTELEWSVCLKSLDTKGCSSKLMMPFIFPSAAVLIAAFTSSFEHFLPTLTTKSTMDTLGVGTRNAMPFSLPLYLGRTSATAFAAPVEVGTMLQAPARARRRSRWRPSRII